MSAKERSPDRTRWNRSRQFRDQSPALGDTPVAIEQPPSKASGSALTIPQKPGAVNGRSATLRDERAGPVAEAPPSLALFKYPVF